MAVAEGDLDLHETVIGIDLESPAIVAGTLTPYEFHISDRVSGLYRAEVTSACEVGEVLAGELIGQDALLTVSLPGEAQRLTHGVITEAEEWDAGGLRRSKRIRIVIRPKLWKLALGRASRIFQRQSVPEIIGLLLRAGGVEHEARLTGDHPEREYCVQYMESDFAFVSRLMEEEGIAYVFRHEQGHHMMVLSDENKAFDDIDGDTAVVFREAGGLVSGEDAIVDLVNQGRVMAGTISLNDFDPLRPAMNLGVKAKADADTDLEIYDHDGRYQQPGDGQHLAKIKLERQRWQTLVVRGGGHCGRLEAGRKFQLVEHPDNAMDKKYLVISVSHHGLRSDLLPRPAAGTNRPADYSNQFEAIPADVPFRPMRSAPWPVVLGAQTAMVTGPAGEEIYTDAHGRVKVQFHWDRDGKRNADTTCWVRVNQGWAGGGWGAYYSPRIGQEVIVEFENGNPDRPLVTGRVYNGAAPAPVELPGQKTKSSVRSSSSPGGSGFNELRLEDAAGSEEVFLHAQKDLVMIVLNNKDQLVKGNETLLVKGDRSREIQKDQELLVKGNDQSTINQNQTLNVNGNRTTTVAGNHTESIGGNQAITIGTAHSLTVALASTEMIGAAKAIEVGAEMGIAVGGALVQTVGAGLDESVEGAKSETVGGNKTESVKGDHSVDVVGNWSETVAKNRSLKVGGDAVTSVGGNTSYAVSKTLKIDAKEIHFAAKDELQIKVGSASLLMKKNGDIIIKGGKIELTASGDLIMKGSKIGEN